MAPDVRTLVLVTFVVALASSQAISTNERLLLDMVMPNPGDPVGWQSSKYTDPRYLASLNFTGKVSTGENSPLLAVNFSTLGSFFSNSSVELSWMESYAMGIDNFIERIKVAGLKAYFFIDMIVLPINVIEHYKEQILNKDGKIVFNDVTAKILTAMFSETLKRFPGIDGFVVRTGETYVYDTPYHKGNSPIEGVKSAVDQQSIWVKFITYLRDTVCENLKTVVLFRGWLNFGGQDSPAQYYLNVSDPIDPHPLFYFCIKHTAGDFWRFNPFNEQLAIGKHAQVIEVECQREYEGKGAFPNYVMDGVINGFSEIPPDQKKGLKDIINSTLIRGLWTWSRGGGWWGPYIHGHEFWIDLHMDVISQWWNQGGKVLEVTIFSQLCSQWFFLSSEDCGIFREIALLSADATLYGHYCPEGDYRACYVFTRDDRLSGLDHMGGHFDWLKNNNKFTESLAFKRNATLIWRQIQSKYDSISDSISKINVRIGREMSASIRYGTLLYDIIYCGWRVMTQGYMHDHQMSSFNVTELHDAIMDYDISWAKYKAFGLTEQYSASLYRGVYFNRPGDSP